MIHLLRRYAPELLAQRGPQLAPQVHSVLKKVALCRTAALGGHVHECPECHQRCPVYNSCLDRHCPQCSGGRRATWLDRTAELLLPRIDYFQVVFTVPKQLAALMLGNRRATYRLLFQAAWQALDQVLRAELGCEPAALLVLHTWNQRLEHHPHVHAVVPGGGPSLAGNRWVRSKHRRHHGRERPYLVDYQLLSERFRERFLAGLRRLHRRGELKLTGDWSHLQDEAAFDAWLASFGDRSWVVYIEPPLTKAAQPEHLLKYLARYLTGGPIADRRLLAHTDGRVTFLARSRDKAAGNRPEPYSLTGVEFARRWSLHILPKGFVKTRCFGGYSGRRRTSYLARCRELLGPEQPPSTPPPPPSAAADPEPVTVVKCPHCATAMTCVSSVARPSWRAIFSGDEAAYTSPPNEQPNEQPNKPPNEPPDG